MTRDSQNAKQRTENQHYVPQFYLRGFTNPSGRMFCFDKVNDKSHPISTAAAAQEPYFYEIPPGTFENGVTMPLNTIEKALCVAERTWAPLHAELIREADAGRISAALTIEYAPFLVMQWMRTRTYRESVREVAQKSIQSLCDDLTDVNFPGGPKPKVTIGDQAIVGLHSQKLFDQEFVQRISDDLERHFWIVGINNTEHLFYTSDHPVVRRGNQKQGERRLVGVQDPGIEFVFPLDSRHVLLILERTHFASWSKCDNRGVSLSADQVGDYNGLQVLRSNQRIFCANDDFSNARVVCAAHPEVRDPNRPRVRVDTTPILPAGMGEDGKQQWKNYMSVTALE